MECSKSVKVRRLTKRSEILSYLEPRRGYAVSGFAYLEPKLTSIIRWYLGTTEESYALCLIARGLFPTYMLTMGDSMVLDSLLKSIRYPGRAFITCEPEHLETLRNHYEFEWQLKANRMIVDRDSFVPVPDKTIPLKPSEVGNVNRLYSLEHSGNFTASQIRRGLFRGIWDGESLVAVAGTHLIAPTYNIAYMGNVLTHPAYRSQGLGTECVSSVTDRLLKQCSEVVLNVESFNLPAVRTYTNLGYKDHCRIVEGVGHRKTFIGVIINNVCRKMGLIPKYEERMEPDG